VLGTRLNSRSQLDSLVAVVDSGQRLVVEVDRSVVVEAGR
jgi:hypothetical protein